MRASRHRPFRLASAAALAALLSVSAPSQGWSRACDQPGFGGTGRVFALGTWRNELVAGMYKNILKDGNYLNHIAHFDGERWLPFGAGLDDYALTSVEFNGELWVGGGFQHAGGVAASCVARWDGRSWRPAGDGLIGGVGTLVVHRGEIYAGGAFTASGSRPISRIARWDGTQWQPVGGGMTWNLGMYASVACMYSDGTLLYAGGEFDHAGGTSASHVAVWDGAAWRALAGGLNNFGWGRALAITGWGGRVYVGGAFGQAGTVLADNIAAWDGSAWSAVGPGVTGGGSAVHSLAVYAGDLYLGGSFLQAGTLNVDRTARWDGTQFHAFGGVSMPEMNPATIIAMTTWNGRLYCGGEFQLAGPAFGVGSSLGVYHITSWDGTRWSAVGPGLGFQEEVQMLGRWRGRTIASGRFLIAGGNYTTELAMFDGNDWRALGTFDGIVSAAVEDAQGNLYVAGSFYRVDGLVANGVARFDGTQWSVFGNGPTLAGAGAITIYQGMIYVGVIGSPMRWNGSTWETFGPPIFGGIGSLLVHNGVLYMGGTTPYMPGSPNLFSWDGTTQQVVGGGVGGVSDAVYALASFGNDLIVGGTFNTVGGNIPARCIARWNGNTWTTFGSGFPGTVATSLAVLGGELYAGGDRLVRWDGGRWLPLTGGDPDGFVHTLLADDARGELHVGGNFHQIGGIDSDYYAIWQRTPSWTNLGVALGSARRTPILWGEGSLLPGSLTHIATSSAFENTAALLILGAQRVDLPVFGGTLIPAPTLLLPGVTSPIGTLALDLPWPAGIARQSALYLQTWILDPLGPQGATASNGLWLRTP